MKALKTSQTTQSVFEKQLTPEVYASVQERLSEFPGFSSVTRYLRTYPDSVAAHFLGFIGEVKDIDIKRSNGYYHQGDFTGITGVEKSYETALRGQRGVLNQMVDSRGRPKVSMQRPVDTAAVAGER